MSIKGTTQLLGIIGNPVHHSLSPTMHNAALTALGVDKVYLPFPVKGEDLAIVLQGLQAIGVLGFNVTIPHKQSVIPLLSELSGAARRIGAVNTVYALPTGGWGGTNTDIIGFMHPLQHFRRDWTEAAALVLGSGGSARAVIQACLELGLQRIRVVGRSSPRLAELQQHWPRVEPLLWEDIDPALEGSDLVINTTPLGMKGSEDQSPLTESQLLVLPSGCLVYDLIYVPNPTRLLVMAATAGLPVIGGLEMLIQQGAASLSLWLGGKIVPVDVMREAARKFLGLAR